MKDCGVVCCPSAINGYASIEDQNLYNLKRTMVGIDTSANRLISEFTNKHNCL